MFSISRLGQLSTIYLPLLTSSALRLAICAQAQGLPPGFTIGKDGPADPATLGFWTNHIGIVRDIRAVQERPEKHGVIIVKGVDSTDVVLDGPIPKAFGIGLASTSNFTEVEQPFTGLVAFELKNVLFVMDTDGNMLEVVEHHDF